jgi:branched-chain amino acid transport system substrate-binding protein
MRRWRDFVAKYIPGADLTDPRYVFAYGVSLTMPEVLKRCGDDFSRENIMKQAAKLKDFGDPVPLPGTRSTPARAVPSDQGDAIDEGVRQT